MEFSNRTCLESGIQEPIVKQERDTAENKDSEMIHHQNKGTFGDEGIILKEAIKCEVTSNDDNDNTLMSDNIESYNTQMVTKSQCINVYDDMIDIVKCDISEMVDNVRVETAPGASNVAGSQASSDEDIPLRRLRPRKRVKLSEDTEKNEDSEMIHHQNKGTFGDEGNILKEEIKCEVTSDDDNDNTQMSDNIESHNTQVLSKSGCINVYDDMIDIVKCDISEVLENVRDDTAPGESNVASSQASSDEDIPLKRLKKRVKLSEDTESSSQSLQDKDIKNILNFGSDDEGSDDDEELAPVFIPRVYREAMGRLMEDEPEDSVPIAFSAEEMPSGLNKFDWRQFPNPPIPPESRRETFSNSNVGPTIPSVDPYDIFIAIWDRQFMEYIATETNRYAKDFLQQNFKSRIGIWQDTTADELYTYLGVVTAMGVVVKCRLEEYWDKEPDLLVTPGFSAHMSLYRFLLLQKFLRFNNDMCAQTASEPKLFKIKPVLSHLSSKFESLYVPNRNIVLEKSLLQWKGWWSIDQLDSNEAATMGIQTYEISEAHTGYMYRFEVIERSPSEQSEDKLNASTSAIVLRLIQGLENKGYTLWMDSDYNSPCLARRLKALGFDCAGTLRTNRTFVPETIHSLTEDSMKPGEIWGLTSGDIDLVVWRDRNRVALISTYHGNGVQNHQGSIKPTLMSEYNITMGGMDKRDQILAMFPIERKQIKTWYKKLFIRLLNISILNSFIIHKHNSSAPLSQRNFRMSLVKSLLTPYSSPSLPKAPQKTHHCLALYPMRGHQRLRRGCVVCKKKVHTFCDKCKKTVCIDPCFSTFHNML